MTNTTRVPSIKLAIFGNNFYSLYGNAIDVYKIAAANGNMNLAYYFTVSGKTLANYPNLNPIAFTPFFSLYVYDSTYGLLSITYKNSSVTASPFKNLNLVSGSYAQLENTNEFLFLFIKTTSNNTIYRIPLTTQTAFITQPLTHCSLPISISVTNNLLSILCVELGYYYAQIYDLNAVTYASLFTEIYPGSQGAFVLGSEGTSETSTAYFTNGQNVYSYIIGQLGDSS